MAISLTAPMPTLTSDQHWKSESNLSKCMRNGVLDYQGEALRAYLAKRCADERAVETLKKYMDSFLEAAPLPRQFRWLGRMRRLFAVVYASAAQAIDYGVLPWSKKATRDAISLHD